MTDFMDVVARKVTDSNTVRVEPGKLIQLFTSGTTTLIYQDVADRSGVFSVPTLATGKYDIKVDGQLIKTFHHVTATHTHSRDLTWSVFYAGALTADVEQTNAHPSFVAPVAGSIIEVSIVAHLVDAAGDLTIHILSGSTDVSGTTVLTVASDSVWNYRIYPAAAEVRVKEVDTAPGIALAQYDSVATGYDWTANVVEGVSVTMVFRPTV